MPAKLTKEQRLRLIERVIVNNEPISKVCQEAGISRVVFYRWLKRYKEEGEIGPKIRKKIAGRQVSEDNIKKIINIVRFHPLWSSQKISQALGKDKNGKPLVGNHGVQNVLFRLSLNTCQKRQEFAKKAKNLSIGEALILAKNGFLPSKISPKEELTPALRLQIIQKVIEEKVPVTKVCQEYKISRPTFYKWLKRYQEVPEDKKFEALENKEPEIERYYRQTPEKYEEVVLSVVSQYPELGVAKIVEVLPKIAGKPIVGFHGVQNILERNNLNTYEKRLAYAQAQVTPVTQLIGRLKEVFSQFFVFPPEKRAAIIRFIGISSLTCFSTIVVFGLIGYFGTIFGQVPIGSQIGLSFATIALFMGSIFFAYSMKYYLTLALVLSFSRHSLEEGGGYTVSLNGKFNGNNGNSHSAGSGLFNWLKKVFGGNGTEPEQARFRVNSGLNGQRLVAGGLQPSLDNVSLSRYPFISVHIPLYNEKKVAERVLSACTSFDYPNYEVIVCDDSTDETAEIVERFAKEWNKKARNKLRYSGPKIKVLHRESREGFKGGALREALKVMDKRTEFVAVFDADFVPYPDTLIQFLKYFKATGGWSEKVNYQAAQVKTMPYSTFEEEVSQEVEVSRVPQARDTRGSRDSRGTFFSQEQEFLQKSNIACVCGYQWHVLNKSENWITRGVRSEYAGSYVIERPGQEILGGLKMIHGSVYCIRADILKHFGWGTSITEDLELTLRLYERGFKVIYTPYIQAPSECVSTIKRLVRQRMRWAEGHSFNIKRFFTKLLFGRWEESGEESGVAHFSARQEKEGIAQFIARSNGRRINSATPKKHFIPSPLSFSEKLEFLYLSPYYLQSFFFLIGTFSWLISEAVFRARLPFWTELWGWSLVLTNFFALPLVNSVGLFMEEAEERDYLGILSFVALSYLLVPFQAYASIKGFLEEKEGPWFRTPKTGKITDIFTRGKFYRFIMGILPGIRPAPAVVKAGVANFSSRSFGRAINCANPYLALATANLPATLREATQSNNQFLNFCIRRRHFRLMGKTVLVFLLIISLLIGQLAYQVPLAQATAGTQIKTVEYFLYQYNSATEITAGNGVDNTAWGATCGSADGDPSVSITIPESGVTFRRVIVEYRTWQSAASGTAASAYDIQFCNSTTTASGTSSGTVTTSSAENNMVLVRLEASSVMLTGTNTYWFDARLVGVTRNLDSLKIYITYEYDQTSATQLKTVYFFGAQQTGTSSTTNLDAVINPNLTEGSITIRDSFAIFKGQTNNNADITISGSFANSATCGTAAAVAVADGGLASAYGYIVLFDMSNTIGLTTSNCIRHAVSAAMFARSIEWVITFQYSYYSAAEADDLLHTKTVRYMMGTVQASLGTSQTAVGSQAIFLPENRPASPFTSVYVQYFSSLDDADTLTTCISTAAACTGTTETQAGIGYGDTIEQSGGITALDDVRSFFGTNWSNGSTLHVSGAAATATNIFGTSAEIIITYKFNADTSSTIIKTVYFWVGQETLSRTNTAFNQGSEPAQANFDTFWPESGTKTFRNGAVYGAFNYNGTTGVGTTTVTSTITVDDLAVGGTDTASVDILGTGENLTREMLVKISSQVPSPFGAQTDINFSMTTNSTTLPVFRSPIAYFTVETATSLAPELAFYLIPLGIILPPLLKIYLAKRKRENSS